MEFKIAQAVTKRVIEETKDLKVKISYIDAIQWPYKNRRWLFPIFKSFLETVAKTNYKKRDIRGSI